jgi:hypothetical protein
MIAPQDEVTWTHVSCCGNSVTMSLKKGVVLEVSGKLATVRTKGGKYMRVVPIANLRHVGERSTLTEFCDEVFDDNRRTNHEH